MSEPWNTIRFMFQKSSDQQDFHFTEARDPFETIDCQSTEALKTEKHLVILFRCFLCN